MNDTDFNYHDHAFDLQQAERYTLLLQLNAASYSYAVTGNNKLLLWGEADELDSLNSESFSELFNARYKQVIIGLQPVAYSLVPENLYSDAHVHDFARLLNVQPAEKVLVQQLDSENRVVYKVSQQVFELAERFGLENTVFAGKGWIKAIAGSNPADDTLYADINGNKVSFAYYNYGRLRFYNTFDFFLG